MLRTSSTRLIGIAFVVALGVVTVVIFTGVFRAPFAPATRLVTADFDRAPQLRQGDQVRIDGEIEGEVDDVRPGPVGEQARVTLKVKESAGPIHADAGARLRFKTLLGGAFYVDLDRGTKGAGPLGDRTIANARTRVQVEVEDITDIFRGGAVTGFQRLPAELATALSDPKPPADAIAAVADIAPDATRAVRAARGTKPGQDLPRLVASAAQAVAALDTPTDDIGTLVAGAAATFDTTGRRTDEIRELLAAGPGLTTDLTQTLPQLDRTLRLTRGLAGRLRAPAPAVAPTLAALRPTVGETRQLLRLAEPTLSRLTPTLTALGEGGRSVEPLLTGLEPALRRADETILPYLARKDPDTGKSTTVMIGGTAAALGGSGGQQDGNGHFYRFPVGVGATSAYVPCKSSLVDPTAGQLLACDTFSTALDTYLSYVPKLTPATARKR